MQLEFNGKVYEEKFGMGLMRELNKRYKIEKEGMSFAIDLQAVLSEIYAGNVVSLSELLTLANKTESDKFTQAQLDEAFENVEIDVEKTFDDVTDALKESNVTKFATKNFEKGLQTSK